ncbi:MAG: hypothetical protein M1827_000650 [Pycnora praestabilis]|nr:MAG: hypothetical protein M1827_000650 [Pycnora praestabilis]
MATQNATSPAAELTPLPEVAGLRISPSPSTASTGTTLPSPPHRSHDPRNNLKRSDPFQFGSRYLEEGDDVYEFNAWDHVETDETYKEYAEVQYAKQRESPVSDFDKRRFNAEPAKWWNLFYRNNTSNFFKNRKWLHQEFPILSRITSASSPPEPITLLEVGAGAGNTAFPILASNQNPRLKIHACDFSPKAVDLIRDNEAYDERYIKADVWDVADPTNTLSPGLAPSSVDIVLMIFIFSALNPQQWTQAIRNIYTLLKPGGEVFFRDYGRGDLAQVRFKKGRYMEENFYVRGDGTRVYFFDRDQLADIWTSALKPLRHDEHNDLDGRGRSEGDDDANGDEDGRGKGDNLLVTDNTRTHTKTVDSKTALQPLISTSASEGFEVIDLGVDRRLLVNRQRKLKMYRCWLQGRFRKKGGRGGLNEEQGDGFEDRDSEGVRLEGGK